jgi:hypothetical protein
VKKYLVILSLILGLTTSVVAEEHDIPGAPVIQAPNQWSYALSELLMSKYYGCIFGGTFYPGPMSFTDIMASRRDAFGSLTFDLSLG